MLRRRLRDGARAGIVALLLAGAPGRAAPPAELRVELSNLRNAKGIVLICMSASAAHFPNCGSDPAARTLRVLAARASGLVFANVAPGRYAISVMHDENGNSKLDMVMGIPREGFGFAQPNCPVRGAEVRRGPFRPCGGFDYHADPDEIFPLDPAAR